MGSARRWARRLERWCCTCAKYFPLAFVYGLTTWAAFVLVSLCSSPSKVSWLGMFWGWDILLDNSSIADPN